MMNEQQLLSYLAGLLVAYDINQQEQIKVLASNIQEAQRVLKKYIEEQEYKPKQITWYNNSVTGIDIDNYAWDLVQIPLGT